MKDRGLTEDFIRAMKYLKRNRMLTYATVFERIGMKRPTWNSIIAGRQQVQEHHVARLIEAFPVTKQFFTDTPENEDLHTASEPTTPYQRLIEAVERENEALRKYCEVLEERLRELQQRLNDLNPKP